MAENHVSVKYSAVDETFAVLVRYCNVTYAVDTMLFGDVEMAKVYCQTRWKVPLEAWEGYLVAEDKSSKIKLNGTPVSYCGWKYDLDETQSLCIHLERKVVEF